MTDKITDLLNTEEAKDAYKALDYYDGEQKEWMEELLSCPHKGRKDWKKRGLIPRTRNITKMIVDKSGLLFNDKPPTLNVYVGDNVDEAASAKLQELLETADWIEFFTNFDSVVRLLKTGIVLVQYDKESKSLILDILHRGNCAVILNRNNKQINTLIYRTEGDSDSEHQRYRVWDEAQITDILVNKAGQEIVESQTDNPYGFIPVATFYDTNTPRTEFWNNIPDDLISMNEMYNIHLIDSEFAASWSKLKTLFTNCRIDAGTAGTVVAEVYNSNLPRMVPDQSSIIGGPSRVIQLDTMGVDSPFVEYKGPDIDLEPIDMMFSRWIRDFASDWSVNVKSEGTGSADSGFKLIVEEIDNLQLRKKRQRMFDAGFKRMYTVIKRIMNTVYGNYFPEDSELFTDFAQPILPVNHKDEEEVWSVRIATGRASRVDYFMTVYGLSKEEAEAKIIEIDKQKPQSQSRAPINVSVNKGNTE